MIDFFGRCFSHLNCSLTFNIQVVIENINDNGGSNLTRYVTTIFLDFSNRGLTHYLQLLFHLHQFKIFTSPSTYQYLDRKTVEQNWTLLIRKKTINGHNFRSVPCFPFPKPLSRAGKGRGLEGKGGQTDSQTHLAVPTSHSLSLT